MCKEVFHNDQMVLSLEENCSIFATFYLSQNYLFSFTAQREINKRMELFSKQDKAMTSFRRRRLFFSMNKWGYVFIRNCGAALVGEYNRVIKYYYLS